MRKNGRARASCKKFRNRREIKEPKRIGWGIKNSKDSANCKRSGRKEGNKRASASNSYVIILLWLLVSFYLACYLLQVLFFVLELPIFFWGSFLSLSLLSSAAIASSILLLSIQSARVYLLWSLPSKSYLVLRNWLLKA